MDLQTAAEIVLRKKWLIAFSVLLTALLTAGVTRLTGSKWTGTVKFISPVASPLAEGPQERQGGTSLDPHAQSVMYLSVVKSLDVVAPALKQAGLTTPAADILDRIDFDSAGDRMYELKVTDTSPRRAEALANAVADSFVRRNQELATQQANKIVRLLEDQMRQADANIARVRNRYDTFSARHKVLGDPNNQLFLVLKRLETSRLNRNEEEARVAQARAQLASRRSAFDRLPAQVTQQEVTGISALGKGIETELAQIELDLMDLRQQYTDTNPKVVALLNKRHSLQTRLREEQGSRAATTMPNPARANLPQSLEELNQMIASGEAAISTEDANIAGAEAEIKQLRDINSPLNTLAAELASATEARTNLSARLNSARIALDTAAQQHPLVIIEHVGLTNPPMNMSAGRSKKLVMLASLCALLAACALVIGLDSADRRVRTMEQVERRLPVRVLAAIPRPSGGVPPAALARATETLPLSPHAEAYRFLGQSLLQAGADIRAVMVISAKSGQGSTNTIVNLAITLAQSGKRVILVDANVRNPRLHAVFGLSNEAGLTNILQAHDLRAMQSAIQRTPVPNLRVLTSGPSSHNPWKLFSSPRMRDLTQFLKTQADEILFDTPSAIAFTDAMNLAPVVDGALLCVRALENLSGEEARLLKQIEQAGVSILGCVMTDVPASVLENFQDHQRSATRSANVLTLEPALESASPDRSKARSKNGAESEAEYSIEYKIEYKAGAAGSEDRSEARSEIEAEYEAGNELTAGLEPDAGPVDLQDVTLREIHLPHAAEPDDQENTNMTHSANGELNGENKRSDVNLPPTPVFARAFNGYATHAVDDYVKRISHILSDLQRHIDQQSLKIEQQSAQLSQYADQVAHLNQQIVSATHSASAMDQHAAQNEQMSAELAEQSARANQLGAELEVARRQMADLLEKEAAGLYTLMDAEHQRAVLEQERTQMLAEIERERNQARQETDALMYETRRQAEALAEANRAYVQEDVETVRASYQAQLEEARAQARTQTLQMLTLLKNEAGALLTEARSAALHEADEKYHAMQEQFDQERARMQADMERERAQARQEADAIVQEARRQAEAVAEETRRNAEESAQRVAESYAAHEERLKALGTECSAVISGIRRILESQPAAPVTPSITPLRSAQSSENGKHAAEVTAAWQ